MKTEDLITTLGAGLRPAGPGPSPRLLLGGLAGGLACLLLVLFWLQPRPDLAEAMSGGFFWLKGGYCAALAAAGFWAVERMSRPGGSPRRGAQLALALFTAMVLLSIVQLALAPAEARMMAWMGHSWSECSWLILAVSLPVLAATLVVLRRLAPTRPTLAGAAAGFFSGGVAATIYGLHCPESSATFVMAWYTLGVAACAGVGALIGARFLRW